MEQLRDACRALDRIVTWSFFQIPDLYLNVENVSYWDRFGIPKVQALYFNADTYFTAINEFGPWPLWTWWDKPWTSGRRRQGLMLAYIVKRILLMVPTLLGALTVTFIVMQFVPGGPVEQIMAEAQASQRGAAKVVAAATSAATSTRSSSRS